MNRPWLKAGLIGGGILLLLNLLALIPWFALSCLTSLLQIVALIGAGMLAARWMPTPRSGGSSAGQGALAGLLAGVLAAVATTILAPLGYSLSGGTEALLSQIPAESLMQLEAAGVDPSMVFGGGTVAGITALCCLPTGAALGALLGALGGLIYASVDPGMSHVAAGLEIQDSPAEE